MVLITNITIDLGLQNAILNSSVGGQSVDIISYDNLTKQVTFEERGENNISFFDFLAFCDQINIFQTAILFNYSTNVFLSSPFSQMIANELHDIGSGTWNFLVTALTEPNVCDYTATKSSLEVYINKRSGSKMLTFPEWLYFLQVLNHYRLSVKQF